MKKNLLLLAGIALVSSTGLTAAAGPTDKRRALAELKSRMSQKSNEINAVIKKMESEGASAEALSPMYTNSSIFDIRMQLADLGLAVDILSESNKTRKDEIKALQAQVAALSSKS